MENRDLSIDPNTLIANARQAQAKSDWNTALLLWQQVAQRTPERPVGFVGTGTVLRELSRFEEADTVLSAAMEKFPENPDIAIIYASIAQRRRDWSEALRRWQSAGEKFPDRPGLLNGAAAMLRELARFDEADTVLREALVKFPDNVDLVVTYATIAQRRANWPDALERWQSAGERFSDRPVVVAGLGTALRELGRVDEADTLLSGGAAKFPENWEIAIAYAALAQHRRDWPEAARRWQSVQDRFPDRPGSIPGLGTALRETGRFDEADIILGAGRVRFPENADIAVVHATIAQRRRDWPEALRRWDIVQEHFPARPILFSGKGTVLRELNRLDDADQVLDEGRAKFPDNVDLAVTYATIAQLRPNWSDALERWNIVGKRFPGNASARAGMETAKREPLPTPLLPLLWRRSMKRSRLLVSSPQSDAVSVIPVTKSQPAAENVAASASGRAPFLRDTWQNVPASYRRAKVGQRRSVFSRLSIIGDTFERLIAVCRDLIDRRR